MEHYSELNNKETNITDSMPDTLPTAEELSRTIGGLPTEKALGLDTILSKIIRCTREVLVSHLLKQMCQCWEEGIVLQDTRNYTIVTLY